MDSFIECSPALQEVPVSIPDWDASVSDALCRGCKGPWSSPYNKVLKFLKFQIFSLCRPNNDDKKNAQTCRLSGEARHMPSTSLETGMILIFSPVSRLQRITTLSRPQLTASSLVSTNWTHTTRVQDSGSGRFRSDGSVRKNNFGFKFQSQSLWRKTTIGTFVN